MVFIRMRSANVLSFVGRPDSDSPHRPLGSPQNLHGVSFGSRFLNLRWAVAALETTARRNHLQIVTICVLNEILTTSDLFKFNNPNTLEQFHGE